MLATATLTGMEIREKLQRLLDEAKAAGVDQQDVAARVGVTGSRISKWLKGTGKPSAGVLLKMSRVFQVPLEYLCDDEQDEPGAYREYDAAVRADAVAKDPVERTVLILARTVGPERAVDLLASRLKAPAPSPSTGPPPVAVHGRPLGMSTGPESPPAPAPRKKGGKKKGTMKGGAGGQ
jgi:transcriptional regulator with XRE-family HTH domain